jgi:hypothetical protein
MAMVFQGSLAFDACVRAYALPSVQYMIQIGARAEAGFTVTSIFPCCLVFVLNCLLSESCGCEFEFFAEFSWVVDSSCINWDSLAHVLGDVFWLEFSFFA